MDPRIRARRIEVARHEGRRRLRRVAVAGGVLGAVALAAAVAASPLLDVDRVSVQGSSVLGPADVAGASGIDLGDALVAVDTRAAAAAVERLPWVAEATVRRDWPGTITIRVTERRPVAAVAVAEDGWVLVDESGHQLEMVGEPPPGLPRVEGVEVSGAPGTGVPAAADGAVALAAAIPAGLPVSSVHVVADGLLEAAVTPPGMAPVPVRLGPARELEAKVAALAALLEQADLTGAIAIDLRVPGSPVVVRG